MADEAGCAWAAASRCWKVDKLQPKLQKGARCVESEKANPTGSNFMGAPHL